MTWWVVLLIALVVVATLGAAWAFHTAQRLNRLHIRLDRSRDALQAALDRRCAVVAALYPQLAPRARATEEVRFTPRDLDSRLEAEAELVGELAQHVGDSIPAQLEDAHTRVQLAQRFYNDAVADTLSLRLRPSVRTLRLGGTAALPAYAGQPRRENRR